MKSISDVNKPFFLLVLPTLYAAKDQTSCIALTDGWSRRIKTKNQQATRNHSSLALAVNTRQSPHHHWRRRYVRCLCVRPPLALALLLLIARQALLRTMEGWQQARLLFPKTKDSACSPSISRSHAAIRLTRNKHRTSIHTLSASFTRPKLGSAHLALAFLKKTDARVCVFSLCFF